MNARDRGALAERLERAEARVLAAQALVDGSPEARMRLERAKAAYREAEADALVALGAREALMLVEDRLARAPVLPRKVRVPRARVLPRARLVARA